VTLTGISKEEKRARVQEAEMKARERLARQKAEKEREKPEKEKPEKEKPEKEKPEKVNIESKVASHWAAVREASEQHRVQSESKPTPGPERRRDIPGEAPRRNWSFATEVAPPPQQRQPGSTAVRQSRTPSSTPQYAAIRRPEDPQYARAEAAIPASAKMGNVPKRSVTVSGPAAKPAPASKMSHSRSVSQAGPRPMPPTLRAERTDELLTAPETPQESAESQTKPKKASVSFDVPPPTPPPIFEWRNAQPGRLEASDFDFQKVDLDRGKAWWEGGGSKDRRKSRALPKNYQTPAQKLTGKNVARLMAYSRGEGPLLTNSRSNRAQDFRASSLLTMRSFATIHWYP
jgi:hypothetical protein